MNFDDLPPEARAKAAHLLLKLEGIELPVPAGYYVLCVQYIRDETIKLKGGSTLFTAPETRREDKFQGRAGLVIAVGPDAYKAEKFGSGPWCKRGDWIAWPAMENAASRIEYEGVVLTVVPDDRVVLVGVDPAKVS